eukprot:Rmarinus@m.26257
MGNDKWVSHLSVRLKTTGTHLSDISNIYEIDKVLGEGAYGSVYKGIHRSSGAEFAVKKVVIEENEFKAEAVEEAVVEILALQSCSHCNIVGYKDSFFKDDALWIVTEYCDGGSVRQLLEKLDSPLPGRTVIFSCILPVPIHNLPTA